MMMKGAYGLLDGVEMPMRDGTILRADLWLPGGDGAWPVLLQRTPYRREDPFGTQFISGMETMAALRRGYAVMLQDTRGRYGSDGDFDPFAREAGDGADTIAWLRGQRFCDGRVAMFGASYVGATQVLAAASSPPGLVAVSPFLTTARHGDTWMYRGGALELAFVLEWLFEALGPEDLSRRYDELDPMATGRAHDLLLAFQRDHRAAFQRLPILDSALRDLAPYMEHWLDPDRVAASGGDREGLDALATCAPAMLVTGGWNDIFVEGSIELFEACRARQSSRDRLILGPWSHGNISDWQGDEWLGYGAAAADLPAEQLAFFDATLAGREPDGPPVRYFRSGSNTWHAGTAWPLPGTEPWALHLDGDGLSATPPATGWSRSYASDPLDPVPTVGGANFLPGLLQGRNSGPKDQAPVEGRPDVLVFTSAPLQRDVEITGLVVAHLWVASSAPTCDWCVKLCDVEPGGLSRSRVDGILRWANPSPAMERSVEVVVRLGHVSHLFRRGHRLRLHVASSNFPRFDRNPQSGTPSALARLQDLATAQQIVVGGAERPSRVVLPVVTAPSLGASSLSAVSATLGTGISAAGVPS